MSVTVHEAEAELEKLRRHPIVQPVCTTCLRINELTKIIKKERD